MSDHAAGLGDPATRLLDLFDRALPQVYGYLLPRCGGVVLAEDLTSETFLAAVEAVRRPDPPAVSIPWVIGVARHKLIDHWRRASREERNLRAVHDDTPAEDPWDTTLDGLRARDALAQLAPQHRSALTLRYVDDLPVAEVAELLDRSLHATEALLVRARAAFRRVYSGEEACDA